MAISESVAERVEMTKIAGRIWLDVKKYFWMAVIVAIYYLLVHRFLPVACPMIFMTGIPCAGCGMTRAVRFILSGHFAQAFYLNPMAFPIVLFAGYCCFIRYLKGRPVKGFVAGIIVLCILLFIFYFVRMYLYFPGRIPYVYTTGNMMETHIPGYRDFIRNTWQEIRH